MNRISLCRLIKPMAYFSDGASTGMLKRYHHSTLIHEEKEAFSIKNYDLLPTFDGSEGGWVNKNVCYEILGPGMIHLKNYVSLLGQVDIVNTCQNLGVGPGGFYRPSDRDGQSLPLHMMCLGRNWDPVTRYEKPCKSDGSEPPPLPMELAYLAYAAIKEAQSHLDELPSMYPDTCIAKFYDVCGPLGLHQDRDESSDSLAKGLPVVSISLGNPAEFCYGYTRDKKKLRRVILESGDVLIFGGKSRLIFHEVKKVLVEPTSMEVNRALRIKLARLNLTLKQY